MAATEADTTFTFEVEGLSTRLSVARIEGVEGISELFEWHLLITTHEKVVAFSDVIGKSAVLTLTHGHEPRYVSGIVSRFKQADEGNRLMAFQVTLVPKLWRLKHRHDARIFQELSVPDIIQKVLTTAGLTSRDFRMSMTGSYAHREYCVQYRESDLAFVSRLMEEEGIYYFFEHSDSGHVLVMGDASASSPPISGSDTVMFRPPLGAMAQGGESVSRFSLTREVRPGKVTLRDFNFKRPALSLEASAQATDERDLEVYDYPGEYELPGDGTSLSKVRLEELQSISVVGEGASGVVRMTPGHAFALSEHTHEEYDARYLLTRIHHHGEQVQMTAGVGKAGPSYGNTFECMPVGVSFRPARKTPRPTVKGVQTAIVTGPSGEEIYTDEHGRVKVHFHWDRLDKSDERSSCWIRVSQLWAGAGWGAMWIPRIGHEVIVDFIEGDPDRPIIIGRVYHGANVPPYPLPAERTKSTIRSDSSMGGGGSNELRFEDKKGSEEIYLHAEKDWTIDVENDKNQNVGRDETHHVERDRTKRVDRDQRESIGGSKKIDVSGVHTETIGGAMSTKVGESFNLDVGADHTDKVGENRSITVGKDHDETISGSMTLGVNKDMAVKVGSASSETVGKSKTTSVEEDYTLTVTKDMNLTVSKNLREDIEEERTSIVGKKISVECGDAKITIEKNGNITVEGKDITVKGTGPIKVEGKKLDLKSDGAVNVEASGKVVIKGSNVGVN